MTYNIEQLNRMNPAYLSAYGLTTAPFSTQHDDRFLYLSKELNEQLNLLLHYSQYGNLLLMVTGERGIGKSSLKERYINLAQDKCKICEIQAHTMMDASLLLRQVSIGFGITEPPLEIQSIHQVLNNQLEHLNQQASTPVLIIDDAHELPQDALLSVLHLAENHADAPSQLKIILFCEPQIETMLEDPSIHSLKDRITHTMEIPKLTEEQTAEYLRHRLAVAGLDGTSPFTPKLINKIYKASHGLPTEINNYAHQNLLDDSEPFISEDKMEVEPEGKISITSYTPRNIALGTLALIVVVLVLFFQEQINQLFEEPVKEETPVAKEVPAFTLPRPEQKDIFVTDKNKQNEVTEKTIEIDLDSKTPSVTTTTEKQAEIVQQTPPVIEETKPQLTQPVTPVLQLDNANPNPVVASRQRQIISISGKGFHKRQKVTVTWNNNKKILPDEQVNITSETFMNLLLTVGMQEDTWTVTLTDPLHSTRSNTLEFQVVKPEVTRTETSKPVIQKSGLLDETWIKQQNKNHFTLQLLGTHQKNAPAAFIKKHTLAGNAAVFKTQRNNQNWYTLVYGSYSDKASAEKAANAMPKSIKPWIRTFASIDSTLTKKIKAEPKAVTLSTPVPINASNPTGWLWSQDPRHYTLQLTAGKNENAIKQFINKHQLKGKAVYFHRVRDGEDWYILLYGSYPNQQAGKEAINALPPALRKEKPWARSFSAIHAELN